MPQAIGSGAPKMMTGVACSATSKVDSWLREARQAQQSGADPNQILKSLIEADIASEARAAAKASKAAARATLQRLQEIASVKSLELRASLASARGEGTMAGDDTGGAGGSMSISGEGQPQPGDVRTYIARSSQRNKSSLPSHLGVSCEFEASTLNAKDAWAAIGTAGAASSPPTAAASSTKRSPVAAPPAGFSYHELLYREGMEGKTERENWRREAADVLIATELQACTFRPAVCDGSTKLVMEKPWLRLDRRAGRVLAEQQKRRQQLCEHVERERQRQATGGGNGGGGATVASLAASLSGAVVGNSSRSDPAFVAAYAAREQLRRARRQQARSDAAFSDRKRHGETFAPNINPRSRDLAPRDRPKGWGPSPPPRGREKVAKAAVEARLEAAVELVAEAPAATAEADRQSWVQKAQANKARWEASVQFEPAVGAASAVGGSGRAADAATADAAADAPSSMIAAADEGSADAGATDPMTIITTAAAASDVGDLPPPLTPPPPPPPPPAAPAAPAAPAVPAAPAAPAPVPPPDPLRAFVSRLGSEEVERRRHMAKEAEDREAEAVRHAAAPRRLSPRSEQLARARRRFTAGVHEPIRHVSPESLKAAASARGLEELTFAPTLVSSPELRRAAASKRRGNVHDALYSVADEWRATRERKRIESARVGMVGCTFEPSTIMKGAAAASRSPAAGGKKGRGDSESRGSE